MPFIFKSIVFAFFAIEFVSLSLLRFTLLCTIYTWLSNRRYKLKVAEQTVHLYDRWAGLRVLPWIYLIKKKELRSVNMIWTVAHRYDYQIFTWLMWATSLLAKALPQIVHRPPSWFWSTKSCIFEVTKPCAPNKCLSRPWSVKNRHWHFWQFNGGRLAIIFGWILTCFSKFQK